MPIRGLSIRGTIPVIAVLVIVITVMIAYNLSRDKSQQAVVKDVSEKIKSRLGYIQSVSEKFIKLGLKENLNQILSSITSEADMMSLLVVNDDNSVVAANNYAELGKDWRKLDIKFNEGLIAQARNTRGIFLKSDIKNRVIEGYAGICKRNVARKLTNKRCGFTVYRVNLDYHYRQTRSVLNNISLYFVIGTGITVIILFTLLHFMINIPVEKSISSLSKFTQGDHDERLDARGNTEFSHIARSINQVLDTVTSNEKSIRDKEARLAAVFNTTIDAIIVIDNQGIIQNINPATEKLLDYKRGELIGHNIKMIMPEPHHKNHDQYIQHYFETGIKKVMGKKRELVALTSHNEEINIELAVTETNIDGVIYFTGVLHDISEQVKLRSAMKQVNRELFESNLSLKNLARQDGLTGLANRRYFDEILLIEIRRAERQHLSMSIMMIDVDHFKLYNDHYGHQQGDECLKEIARLMGELFKRAGDLPARYGGEEFSVILPGTDDIAAEFMAKKFIARLSSLAIPHEVSASARFVTVSIGVATIMPGRNNDKEMDILKLADVALYRAKTSGRNRVCLYGQHSSET